MFKRCPTPTPTPTPAPTPTPTLPVSVCPLKITPTKIKNSAKQGNHGLDFPLYRSCDNLLPEYLCYLALEDNAHLLGDTSAQTTTNSEVYYESGTSVSFYYIPMPCLDEENTLDDFCWLGLEEDPNINFEHEANIDYFEVPCTYA